MAFLHLKPFLFLENMTLGAHSAGDPQKPVQLIPVAPRFLTPPLRFLWSAVSR